MLLYRVLALGICCLFAQTATAANTPKHPLNGWYPCSEVTFSDPSGRPRNQTAECAVYSAPLCYPGICKAPATADPTVDIFVKRLPASVGDTAKASNAWLLSGGPGFSSVRLEQTMKDLHMRLWGKVNVYTLDHRGTGRSTLFDCVAAQAMTSGSPRGRDIRGTEVPSCAKDLHTKYGDLSSFSITSAASDLASFISDYSNGANTFVYGESYGTALVERLMHLNPVTVKGYVLDGVAAPTGVSPGKFEYFSLWDADYGEVGEYFMGLCGLDSDCKTHFQSANLSSALRDLMTKIDNDRNSTCASLVASGVTTVPPSYMLRTTLGQLLKEVNTRTLIPPVVYRLHRCSTNDVDVLNQFFAYLDSYTSYSSLDDPYFSSLVFYLIMFSEMWEIPAPSQAQIEARLVSSSIATGDTYYFKTLRKPGLGGWRV